MQLNNRMYINQEVALLSDHGARKYLLWHIKCLFFQATEKSQHNEEKGKINHNN